MRKLSVLGVFLSMILLGSSWTGASGKSLRWQSALDSVVSGKLANTAQRSLVALIAGSTLLLGTATAPVVAQEEAAVWTENLTHNVYNSVLYVSYHNPETEEDLVHEAVYIGDTITGEALLVSLYFEGNEYFESRDEKHGISYLYDRDGLVSEGFKMKHVKIFSDPLEYWEVLVFTLKGVDLRGMYEPVMPDLFPLHEVGDSLVMLQYGINEHNPESVVDLPLLQRTCKVLPPQGWANVGVGVNSCAPLDSAHNYYGLPVFNLDGNLVAFNTGPSGTGYTGEGMLPHIVDYIHSQQANPTAVSSRGKLSTSWGAIKAGL